MSTKVKWSILIATTGPREERFLRLIKILMPQVDRYKGEIEVLIYWNNFEKPLSDIRQSLVEQASGEYINFIDDDDIVPDYYCDEVMGAIASKPDYVGWKMQLYEDGEKQKPTFHSLRYADWYENENGWYRNISHLNPIKKEIALKVSFVGSSPEDVAWAKKVAPFVNTENYINRVMYEYLHSHQDTTWGQTTPPLGQEYTRPTIKNGYFKYHPASQKAFTGRQ